MGLGMVLSFAIVWHFGGGDGPARAGTYVIASTALYLVATLTRFGAETLALRLTAADPALGRPWARPALLLSTGLSVVAGVALALFVGFQPTLRAEAWGWPAAIALGTALIPINLMSLGGAWLRALGRIASGTFLEQGAVPFCTLVGLVAAGLGFGDHTLSTALFALAAGAWATGLLTAWLAIPRLRAAAPDVEAERVGAYLRAHGRPLLSLTLTAIGFFCYQYIATLFFGVFHRGLDAGYFNLARTLANFVGLLALLQTSMLSPQFAALQHVDDHDAVNRVNWKATALATAFGATLALPMLIAPEWILTTVSRHAEYAAGAPVLRVLTAVSLLVTMLGQVYSLMLTGKDMEKQAARITFVALVATVAIMLVVMPFGSTWIAAASTLAPFLFAVAGHVILGRHHIRSAVWQIPPRP